METYVINIDGEEFVGAPTMATEEVNKAFDAAVKEWPEVRREHHKKWLLASILLGIGGDRMSVETDVLNNEGVELSYTLWQIRHGVVVQHGKDGNRLTAWTKDGRIIGPEIKNVDEPEDGDFSIRIRHEKVKQGMFREGVLERYIITINDKEYIGAPTYTRQGADAAFEVALVEMPTLKESRREVWNKIKKLKSIDADRMDNAIHLLKQNTWRITREWEAKYGVAQEFFIEDEKFHLKAWTIDGMVMGPLAGSLIDIAHIYELKTGSSEKRREGL